jgi:hypothetical protein
MAYAAVAAKISLFFAEVNRARHNENRAVIPAMTPIRTRLSSTKYNTITPAMGRTEGSTVLPEPITLQQRHPNSCRGPLSGQTGQRNTCPQFGGKARQDLPLSTSSRSPRLSRGQQQSSRHEGAGLPINHCLGQVGNLVALGHGDMSEACQDCMIEEL